MDRNNFFNKDALQNAQLERVAKELELRECTDRAIELAKEFTVRLEMEKPTVRCLTAFAINKTYWRMFPKVYEAIEKLGI